MSSSGGTGFLIGGFAQKKFELRPKNTVLCGVSKSRKAVMSSRVLRPRRIGLRLGISPLPAIYDFHILGRDCGSKKAFYKRNWRDWPMLASNTIIKMESGENKNLTLETLRKVAQAFDVSVENRQRSFFED